MTSACVVHSLTFHSLEAKAQLERIRLVINALIPSHEIVLRVDEECDEHQERDADVHLNAAAVGT